jgi:hypothetical protein
MMQQGTEAVMDGMSKAVAPVAGEVVGGIMQRGRIIWLRGELKSLKATTR